MENSLKIMTYNLRCVWDGDGINAFIHRAGLIDGMIGTESPDVIGFQEVVEKSRDFLKRTLTDYEFVGTLRNEDLRGEGCYIAFKKKDFVLLALDTFWLSPTPAVPGSRFEEQSKCPRVTVAAYFYHKPTGKFLWVYDTHLDHLSESARVLGMKCLLERMAENGRRNPAETVLMGDFNTRPGTETLRLIEETASPALAEITSGIPGTFHDFGRETDPVRKIDYIYASAGLVPERTYAVTACHEGIFLSDHYPVVTEVSFREKGNG